MSSAPSVTRYKYKILEGPTTLELEMLRRSQDGKAYFKVILDDSGSPAPEGDRRPIDIVAEEVLVEPIHLNGYILTFGKTNIQNATVDKFFYQTDSNHTWMTIALH